MTKMTALCVPLAILLASCSREEPKAATTPEKAPVPVTTATVQMADWPSGYEATGTVRARTSVVVSARMTGHLREVHAQLGDRVAAGQPLATLDAQDLDTSVSRAEAGRDEARSMVPEAETAIAAAKAQLELAQSTHNRMRDLFNTKSISPQEMDEANARLKGAQSALDMAQARRRQLDYRVAQAEQEVKASGINRGYANIVAPFSGIVTAKSAEPGSLATPGAPLFTIDRDGALRLEAQVEESRLRAIAPRQRVMVTLEGLGQPLDLTVSELVPSIDPVARTGVVRIDLPGAKGLRSGAFGRALFPGDMRRTLVIPSSAVIERGQLQTVFIVENGVARSRLVSLGDIRGGNREVLSGLREGEVVAANPQPTLTDGSPVGAQQ
jgi:RND family efflux transporter MFP subunit